MTRRTRLGLPTYQPYSVQSICWEPQNQVIGPHVKLDKEIMVGLFGRSGYTHLQKRLVSVTPVVLSKLS